MPGRRKEGSASFLKKRSKKLCSVGFGPQRAFGAKRTKVFLLLFLQKKKALPCLPHPHEGRAAVPGAPPALPPGQGRAHPRLPHAARPGRGRLARAPRLPPGRPGRARSASRAGGRPARRPSRSRRPAGGVRVAGARRPPARHAARRASRAAADGAILPPPPPAPLGKRRARPRRAPRRAGVLLRHGPLRPAAARRRPGRRPRARAGHGGRGLREVGRLRRGHPGAAPPAAPPALAARGPHPAAAGARGGRPLRPHPAGHAAGVRPPRRPGPGGGEPPRPPGERRGHGALLPQPTACRPPCRTRPPW